MYVYISFNRSYSIVDLLCCKRVKHGVGKVRRHKRKRNPSVCPYRWGLKTEATPLKSNSHTGLPIFALTLYICLPHHIVSISSTWPRTTIWYWIFGNAHLRVSYWPHKSSTEIIYLA